MKLLYDNYIITCNVIIPFNLWMVNMHIRSHLFNPHATAAVICHQSVGHIQVRRLLKAGGNLQEDFCDNVLFCCKEDVHVVRGWDNALGTGEVLHVYGFYQPKTKKNNKFQHGSELNFFTGKKPVLNQKLHFPR